MQYSKLYVGNFSYSVNNQQLEELFANHGQVKEVRIIEGKGFGFVEMGSVEEAEKAMEALNGTEWEGRTLKVDEARPPKDRNSGGPRGGGGSNRPRGNYQGGGGYRRF